MTISLFWSWLYLTFAISSTVNGYNLTDELIANVSARLEEGAQKSWELGARAQAILELNATDYSVLSPKPLPPPQSMNSSLSLSMRPFFDIARKTVTNRSESNNHTTGPQPLMNDGSAADPASIGFAVILANWTGMNDQEYVGAAQDQLDYLYQRVPRTDDGAISHRVSEVQLWSDFVYMVPPFLAYYGVITNNQSWVAEAYNQISLYRNYLRDDDANGLWKHVLLGSQSIDEGHWSTGNGWAAAGMLRVLGTMKNSAFSDSFESEQNDLAEWINEIHEAMYQHLDASVLTFTNYADVPSYQPGNFFDSASTALMASTVYRLALVWGTHTHLPIAEKTRQALGAPGPNNTLVHFDQDGWLTPVVNPHSYGSQGDRSPEGQAFVVMMQAAWRDWIEDGAKGADGARRMNGGLSIAMIGGFMISILFILTVGL